MKKKPLYQRDLASLKSFEKLRDRFREQYELIPGPRFTLQRRYFDTFDWRLYRSGNVLEVDGTSGNSHSPSSAAAAGHFEALATSGGRESGPEPSAFRLRALGKRGWQRTMIIRQDPDFSCNIQEPDLRQYLEPILSGRRLLLQAEVPVSIEPYEVMDDNGKVVLRLELEKYLHPDRNGRFRSILVNCRFNPLKGYSKVCRHLLGLIDNDGGRTGKIADPCISILSLENITPADYSNKLNITFDPGMTIGQALATTLLFHIGVMRKNLPGIKADLDMEFLHDFRIANRRSRTLVTQIKHVLPPVQQKYYKSIFSWLSDETSAHRDLDVFIHDIPRYISMLPRGMREDLEPLRDELEKKRKRVHSRLLKVLDSDRFLRFEAEYQPYLADGLDNHFHTETGSKPVVEIASKSIWRVYKKLLKQGNIASTSGVSEDIHELRKIGKKFRYLLETFRSLYPERDIEEVIMHCRKLQNLLGRIVDYHVQQSYLLGLMEGRDGKSGLPDSTNTCIRYLVDTYVKQEEKARGKFEGRFARFSNPKTQNKFRILFREPK